MNLIALVLVIAAGCMFLRAAINPMLVPAPGARPGPDYTAFGFAFLAAAWAVLLYTGR